MQDVLSNYVTFYKKKHENRKLDFDHSLGTAQVHAQFKAGSKELTLSLYQAVILLMFNDQDVLSYAEIKENTGLSEQTTLPYPCRLAYTSFRRRRAEENPSITCVRKEESVEKEACWKGCQ